MNFDLNAKSSPQRRPNRRPAPAQSSAQKPATASVPISVYRELSAELQATQAMLDSLHGQNQQLRKQNVHLQQEVDSIVEAAQKMQSMAAGQKPDLNANRQSFAAAQEWVTSPEAAALETAAPGNVVQPSGEVPPQLHPAVQGYVSQPGTAMPPRISEPPRPQEMPIMPEGVEPLAVRAPEAMSEQAGQHFHHPAAANPEQSASPFSPARRQAAIETLNKIFTGREQPLPHRALEDESSEEIHTGWLVLIVLLIVVTAFGTGFMIVRPFLSNNR